MKLDDINEFRNGAVKRTLRDASYDETAHEYMTNCREVVICFDSIKCAYLKERGLRENKAKSVDALFQSKHGASDDEIYMVEFKNGADFESHDIEMKAKDSLLIFNSIVNKQLDYSRENLHFILVYNEDRCRLNYRDRIALSMANRGRQEFAMFGLVHLRGYCFKSVWAFDRKEFEKRIRRLL